MDPWLHYLQHGIREGRKPHRLVEPSYFLDQGTSADAARTDPLLTLLADRTAASHALFDGRAYLDAHPEIAEPAVHPLVHYGRAGGRGSATEGGYFGIT